MTTFSYEAMTARGAHHHAGASCACQRPQPGAQRLDGRDGDRAMSAMAKHFAKPSVTVGDRAPTIADVHNAIATALDKHGHERVTDAHRQLALRIAKTDLPGALIYVAGLDRGLDATRDHARDVAAARATIERAITDPLNVGGDAPGAKQAGNTPSPSTRTDSEQDAKRRMLDRAHPTHPSNRRG